MTKIKDKERLLKAVREKATVKVKSLSRVRLFATPGTIVYQAPQPMEFSRQEYWNELPFPSPGDLPLNLQKYIQHSISMTG